MSGVSQLDNLFDDDDDEGRSIAEANAGDVLDDDDDVRSAVTKPYAAGRPLMMDAANFFEEVDGGDSLNDALSSEMGSDVELDDSRQMAKLQKHFRVTLPFLDDMQKVQFVRLPKYIRVDPEPYDAATFDFGAELGSFEEDEEVALARISNTVRWRWVVDHNGNKIARESNSCFVSWDDGSWSLIIGKEVFDVVSQPLDKQYKYVFRARHQRVECSTGVEGQASDEAVTILEEVGRLSESWTLKSTTANVSATRKWAQVGESKLKMTVTREDPLMIKRREEAAMLERAKMDKKKKKLRDDFRKVYHGGLTKEYLEADHGDEDEDSQRFRQESGAKKRQQQRSRAKSRRNRYSSDEEEEEDEQDDEDEEDEDYMEGEDDVEEESETDESDDGDDNVEADIQFSDDDEDVVKEELSSNDHKKSRAKSILHSSDDEE
jgi:RNA polymerase-associated protein LEO1